MVCIYGLDKGICMCPALVAAQATTSEGEWCGPSCGVLKSCSATSGNASVLSLTCCRPADQFGIGSRVYFLVGT